VHRFPAVAEVDGDWWVLRMNSFPDHPLWTLFVRGVARFDLNDLPEPWGRPLTAAPMPAELAEAVLAPVRSFVAYGSEVGQPCDDPFCCG